MHNMHTRRSFITRLGGPAIAAMAVPSDPVALFGALESLARHRGNPREVAADEEIWREVQQAYTVDRSIINLNNGAVNPSPAIVQQAMKGYLDYSHEAPPYTMGRILAPQRENVRQSLARALGCDTEEVALTRNTTEGMEICQLGLELKRGDEVLTTNQDYWRFLNTWKQRERRDGVILKQISIPTPAEDPSKIVALFEQNITSRTRAILLSHVINLTGQILPVRDVVWMARARNIPVLVDGAHSFAHFDFKLADLDCDYYATSLHKWLGAPHGTGMLYVRKEKIPDLWPLMPAPKEQEGNIRKFEQIGTHPVANQLAIAEALTFYHGIGATRKEDRLRYLRDRWAKRLLNHDCVRLHTSLKPEFSCALATVQIEGTDSGAVASRLWERHQILVRPIKHAEYEGIRVTPNVYTTLEELDRFGDAMELVVRHGIPRV